MPAVKREARTPPTSEEEFEAQERERRADLKERDEFATRLREKDKEKTRQIMSKSDKKVFRWFVDLYNDKSQVGIVIQQGHLAWSFPVASIVFKLKSWELT